MFVNNAYNSTNIDLYVDIQFNSIQFSLFPQFIKNTYKYKIVEIAQRVSIQKQNNTPKKPDDKLKV